MNARGWKLFGYLAATPFLIVAVFGAWYWRLFVAAFLLIAMGNLLGRTKQKGE